MRIGVRCSEQNGRNLETALKGQEVHCYDHRFCRSAGLLPAQRNSEHSVPARSDRRPFGSKRLILSNSIPPESISGPLPPAERLIFNAQTPRDRVLLFSCTKLPHPFSTQ